MRHWAAISGMSWDSPGRGKGAMVEKETARPGHRGGEPGTVVSAEQPEFPAVWTKGTAWGVPQPLEGLRTACIT